MGVSCTLTLSLPFQTNEYNRLLIILMKSFLVEIRDARYRIFGIVNDLITCILPNKAGADPGFQKGGWMADHIY